MAKSSVITIEPVKAELDKIKASFPEPPVDLTYKYLKALYRLRERFGDPGSGEIYEYFDAQHKKLHRKVQRTYSRMMIEKTADWILPQLKSRYANALEFVFSKKIPSKRFITFMKSKGGIKACDELYRKAKRARKHK